MPTFKGRYLHSWRIKKDLSFSKLADLSHVPRTVLAGWEVDRGAPTYDQALALGRALEVRPSELYDWPEEPVLRLSPEQLLEKIYELELLVGGALPDSAELRGPMARVFSPARLRQARKEMGWTQTELATRLGVKRLSVIRWENGQTIPNGLMVLQLSGVLERPRPWFFGTQPVPRRVDQRGRKEDPGSVNAILRASWDRDLSLEDLVDGSGLRAEAIRQILDGGPASVPELCALRRAVGLQEGDDNESVFDPRVRAELYELEAYIAHLRLSDQR